MRVEFAIDDQVVVMAIEPVVRMSLTVQTRYSCVRRTLTLTSAATWVREVYGRESMGVWSVICEFIVSRSSRSTQASSMRHVALAPAGFVKLQSVQKIPMALAMLSDRGETTGFGGAPKAGKQLFRSSKINIRKPLFYSSEDRRRQISSP